MQNIINKLIDKQEPFSIESSTDGGTRLTIPLLGESREMEIIEDGSYKIVMPSLRPFTLPKESYFESEKEVMEYLFKEEQGMAKKAVKRPDEVEYIEFKGIENFKEVCEFIGSSGELITNEKGIERLLLQQYKFDKDVRVPTGTIFYKWNNYGKDALNYGETSWAMTTKDDFFKRYKEDAQ